MDEDLSSFAHGNTDFDVGPVSHDDVEAEDAAAKLKREKQVCLYMALYVLLTKSFTKLIFKKGQIYFQINLTFGISS